jgi:predicted  nucleic acid-binding Zn-ribbon protein
MKNIMESLFSLQSLQLESTTKQADRTAAETLRKSIAAPILAHYDRLMAHGKKGVAVVRNGVCTECHIRVAIGALADLALGSDIQVCGNCGRYLYLPANEPIIPSSPAPAARKVRRKREALVPAHAA